MKNQQPVKYDISSSIWSGIKHKYSEVILNSSWLVGNRSEITFWTDNWCGEPLVSTLNISAIIQPLLKSFVSNFINGFTWNLPTSLVQIFPNLQSIIDKVYIPVVEKDDQLMWKHTHDGNLSFKDAYQYHCEIGQNISWAKITWNKSIPPSKYLMVWRSLHNKLPTDENLSSRGCQFPSIYCLCRKEQETTNHLLLTCDFAKLIWKWLASIIKIPCIFVSIQKAINVSQRSWSPLCKVVVLSAVINCLNTIWYCRNQLVFSGRKINHRSAINLIISATAMSGNNSKCAASSSIPDFVLLKAFSVKINYGNAPKIKEIIWQPPVFDWIKCNIDGASLGNPGPSSCGGIFRDKNADFLGAFAYNLGISNSLVAELNATMFAIELAHHRGWNHIWLESDSMFVTLAFKSKKIVPWQLRNRWENCWSKPNSQSLLIGFGFVS